MNEGVLLIKRTVYFNSLDCLEGETPKPWEMKPYSSFKDKVKGGPERTKRRIVVRYSDMKRICRSFNDCSLANYEKYVPLFPDSG